MAGWKLTRELYDEIQKLDKVRPRLTNDEIAIKLSIARGTVSAYRGKPFGTAGFNDRQRQRQRSVFTMSNGNMRIDELAALKKENSDLKKQMNVALDAAIRDQAFKQFVDNVAARPIVQPEWMRKTTSSTADKAIITAFLSDLHLDEKVKPEQIGFVNEFNRPIAEKRLKNFFNNTIQLATKHLAGIECEGITLPLGGDIFSGNIHEELRNTNEATLIESLLYWPGLLVSGIKELAYCFKKVYIPGVVGNHGRNSMKPIMKNRAQDNFDYLLYHMLARELKDDKRVTFAIAEAADHSYELYATRFILTHGDQFRGGSGISGVLSPLMIGDHRKRKRQVAINRPYDWMLMGHWHQLTLGVKGVIVNGSLKGYDEYSAISNFDFEPPQQAFFLTQPKHGLTGRWPIHVADKSERYGMKAA